MFVYSLMMGHHALHLQSLPPHYYSYPVMWSMLISTITEPTWCSSFMEAVESECWMLCISCSLGFVVLSLFAGSENKTRRRVNVSSPWCFFKCFFWMMIRLWHGMPPLVLWWSKAQEEVGLNGTHMCAAEKDVQGHLQPNPSFRLVVVAERYRLRQLRHQMFD